MCGGLVGKKSGSGLAMGSWVLSLYLASML